VLLLVNIDEISGKKVIGTGGYEIGEVKSAEVNLSNWNITHLQVKLSSQAADEMGYKKTLRSTTVCMPVSYISAVGDVITINKSLNELTGNAEISECH
jgi:sporulation protein YlmC with PRC-barrel domain